VTQESDTPELYPTILVFQASTEGIASLDPLDKGYSKQFQAIARYLTSLAKPKGMFGGKFYWLKKEALNYSI
jgi:hypothetical protein